MRDFVGSGLTCYQAWCEQWGHDFGDEVCKRCGDSAPEPTTTGTMLDLINAAIGRGAKAGDVLTVQSGDGKAQKVTLGHTVPTTGEGLMLVAIATESTQTKNVPATGKGDGEQSDHEEQG